MNFKWKLPKIEDFDKKERDDMDIWEFRYEEYPGGPLAFCIKKTKDGYEGFLRYIIIGSNKRLLTVYDHDFENCYYVLIAKSIEKILKLDLTIKLREKIKTKEDILNIVNKNIS